MHTSKHGGSNKGTTWRRRRNAKGLRLKGFGFWSDFFLFHLEFHGGRHNENGMEGMANKGVCLEYSHLGCIKSGSLVKEG